MNLKMESDAQMVEEVVVVAYGVRKKGTIAGSVSTVKAEKMEDVPAPSFDQALQGQAPGLMVLSESGEPSKAATFRIRGTNRAVVVDEDVFRRIEGHLVVVLQRAVVVADLRADDGAVEVGERVGRVELQHAVEIGERLHA